MMRTIEPGQLLPSPGHFATVLPVETTLDNSIGDGRYRIGAPGALMFGESLVDPYTLQHPFYLQHTPSGDAFTLPKESARQFAWRIRDTALAAQERAGVALGPVKALAESTGGKEPLFVVGGVVSSAHDLRKMPVGSVVYSGHPDKPDVLDVFEVQDGGSLLHVLGRRGGRNAGQPMIIHSMPSGTEGEVGEPADEATLLGLAIRTYRLGKAAQSRHHWCSVYDSALATLGIDQTVVAEAEVLYGPGDQIARATAASLPEGTLLVYEYQRKNAYAVFVRDDDARGTAKTRRVWGFEDSRDQSHDVMTIVATPSEEMAWLVPGWALTRMPDSVVYLRGSRTRVVGETRALIEFHETYYVKEFPV